MTADRSGVDGGRGPKGAGAPAVELIGVTKTFGDVVAVHNMDLAIEENRFFALLGPSGCGKTTTLRMIGGFDPPTAGTVLLHGEDVTDLKPYRRPVNTVFQSYALFPHLSVFENMAFGLRRRKVSSGDVAARVEEMLELVQLPGFGRRRPRQLSGGQRQRVALGRALINHPRVLLLDEPLGALDLKLRKEMQIELKRIQHEVGITFIHVTHDQEEAMTMADTIAVMNDGRIERIGSPVEIYDDPRSPFVANFLGASNLLDVKVVDAGRGEVALDGGARLFVTPGSLASGSRAARIGVRPEKVGLYGREDAGLPANVLDGRVLDASFTGVSTQFIVEVAPDIRIASVVQNVAPGRFRSGDEVRVGWLPEHSFAVYDGDE